MKNMLAPQSGQILLTIVENPKGVNMNGVKKLHDIHHQNRLNTFLEN